MKKTVSIRGVLFIGVAGLFLSFALLSCGSKESAGTTTEVAASEASGSSDCLNGKWTAIADNVEKSFTFNDDHTGQEVNTPEQINQFTWKKKEGNEVAIVYVTDPPSTQEWTFTLDCEAGTLLVFGISFKK